MLLAKFFIFQIFVLKRQHKLITKNKQIEEEFAYMRDTKMIHLVCLIYHFNGKALETLVIQTFVSAFSRNGRLTIKWIPEKWH